MPEHFLVLQFPVKMGRPRQGTPEFTYTTHCHCGERRYGTATTRPEAKRRALAKMSTHLKKMSKNSDSSVAGN